MADTFLYILFGAAAGVIAVKIAITISPRFRRWVYSKD